VRKRILRSFPIFVLVAVLCTSLLTATAQQGNTTTYVYDANGRLHAVISPSGEATVYEYDAAGNITSIRRLPATTLAIISFSPHEGLPGDPVTFIGTGFGGGVTNVSFNGASAAIVSVSPSKVVATVPPAATTGLVTITTPTGSVTTATPFTIAGLRITPTSASVKFGESLQFTAEVLPSTLDQTVEWSVEGVVGGNTNVGTISTTGLYVAPNTRFSALTVRATSVADNTRFAEAQVRVSDPNDVQTVIASAVSVSRGENVNTSAVARPLAVQHGSSGEVQTAVAKPLAVQHGSSGEVQAAVAASLAVQHGDLSNAGTALSPAVSVQRGDVSQLTAVTAVAATRGPFIQSLSPTNITRGTAVTLTINGVGLTGATVLRFINSSGTTDTTITVSNIVVSGDGLSLTATVSVSATSALGSRTIFISTPDGDSITFNLGINVINVQ
jgi:YD repeat-containing protein